MILLPSFFWIFCWFDSLFFSFLLVFFSGNKILLLVFVSRSGFFSASIFLIAMVVAEYVGCMHSYLSGQTIENETKIFRDHIVLHSYIPYALCIFFADFLGDQLDLHFHVNMLLFNIMYIFLYLRFQFLVGSSYFLNSTLAFTFYTYSMFRIIFVV